MPQAAEETLRQGINMARDMAEHLLLPRLLVQLADLRASQRQYAEATGLLEEAGWDRPKRPSETAAKEFGKLVAGAAKPIDDVRGTAAYRRHVLAVMGARALARVAVIP